MEEQSCRVSWANRKIRVLYLYGGEHSGHCVWVWKFQIVLALRNFWNDSCGSVLHHLVFLVLEKYAFSCTFTFNSSIGAFYFLRNNVALDFANSFFCNFCTVPYFDKREKLYTKLNFVVTYKVTGRFLWKILKNSVRFCSSL